MGDTSPFGVPSVLTRLRAETRDLHDAAESTVGLLDGPFDIRAYQAVLQRWYGFLVVLEPRLTAWHHAHGLLDWEQRHKIPLLATDLETLGVDRAARLRLPRCPLVPTLAGTAEALGALYVVEGSTLGGRVQQDRLPAGSVPDGAQHFLGAYGPDLGRRWHGYRVVTSRWVSGEPARADAVVAAARATYEALVAWQATGMAAT